jgi:hypothetical protein
MIRKKELYILAKMLGTSLNIGEFENRLIEHLRATNPAFDEARFRKEVQKWMLADTAQRMNEVNAERSPKCPLCGSSDLIEVSMQEYPQNNECNGFRCQKCDYKDYKAFFKA